jgi:MFS superfamily sulfate permease-like transporter
MKTSNLLGIFGELKKYWKQDSVSGFLVSLIAMPLCLGIASASGFPPIMGVLTAIIGGMFVSIFAGSPLTIKGPAAGLIVIIAGSVEELGKGDATTGWQYTAALVAAAGIGQILLGTLKLPRVADFFPVNVVQGMLAAIGLIIFSKQSHLALGIAPSELKGKDSLELLMMIPHSIQNLHAQIATIGCFSLGILLGWNFIPFKTLKKIPPALIVLCISIAMGAYFNLSDPNLSALKPLVNPGEFSISGNADFSIFSQSALFGTMLKYFTMILLIGSLESVLSGRAIDLIDPEKRTSDLSRDLQAVGMGNTLAGILGGLPMIAEVARSSANIAHGAKSRWANFFHGLILLVFVVFLVPIIKMIPVAALSAMLIFIGYRLASPKLFDRVFKTGWEQLLVFIATIVVTLATDLLLGIAAGIAVEFLVQLLNGVSLKSIAKSTLELDEDSVQGAYTVRIVDSAVFSNYLKLKRLLNSIPSSKIIVIDFDQARIVDHTVLENLSQFKNEYIRKGGVCSISGLEQHRSFADHQHSTRVKK